MSFLWNAIPAAMLCVPLYLLSEGIKSGKLRPSLSLLVLMVLLLVLFVANIDATIHTIIKGQL